jgi:sulfur relay protein TusB/DsrH
MSLAVFVSDFKRLPDTLNRLKSDKLGIILVQDGVNYAALKENGKTPEILEKGTECYALSEDLQTRGFTEADVDSKVKVIDYNALVDVIFNEFEKLAWL